MVLIGLKNIHQFQEKPLITNDNNSKFWELEEMEKIYAYMVLIMLGVQCSQK